MKRLLTLMALLAAATSSFAQGIIQFDWQGDQNLFQASFQVTEAEYALGWPYGTSAPSTLMCQTLTVTAPDHIYGPGLLCLGWTETTPDNWHRVCVCYGDPDQTFPGRIYLSSDPVSIGEDGSVVATESGSWSSFVVPEPSCAALLGLGLLGLYMKRATSRV